MQYARVSYADRSCNFRFILYINLHISVYFFDRKCYTVFINGLMLSGFCKVIGKPACAGQKQIAQRKMTK